MSKVWYRSTWIETFIRALPIAVARKKVLNGIRKCPHIMPARSKSGLGIEAHRSTTMNAFFLIPL